MDIKEEREAFEDWFSCNAIRDHEYVRGERMDENGNYYSEYAYLAWSAWQAAKAQAVPEGFVLVNAESLALHAKSIRMFNNSEEEEDYYEIENHVCAIEAMIEAQEQKG